jgi:hypothetical protein
VDRARQRYDGAEMLTSAYVSGDRFGAAICVAQNNHDVAEIRPTELRGTQVNGKFFNPTGWSPDGARLSGIVISDSGRPSSVGIYDFATQTTSMLADAEACIVKWLSDNRRIVFSRRRGRSHSPRHADATAYRRRRAVARTSGNE